MEQPNEYQPIVDGDEDVRPKLLGGPYDHNQNPHSEAGISQAVARERAGSRNRGSQTPALGHISLKGEVIERSKGRGYTEAQ